MQRRQLSRKGGGTIPPHRNGVRSCVCIAKSYQSLTTRMFVKGRIFDLFVAALQFSFYGVAHPYGALPWSVTSTSWLSNTSFAPCSGRLRDSKPATTLSLHVDGRNMPVILETGSTGSGTRSGSDEDFDLDAVPVGDISSGIVDLNGAEAVPRTQRSPASASHAVSARESEEGHGCRLLTCAVCCEPSCNPQVKWRDRSMCRSLLKVLRGLRDFEACSSKENALVFIRMCGCFSPAMHNMQTCCIACSGVHHGIGHFGGATVV